MAKLVRIMACLCMSLFFGSCIFEYPPEMEDNDAYIDSDRVVLQINLKPIAASEDENQTEEVKNPTEKVKSLRVVIIGKGETSATDTIECNRLIDVPEMVAANYSYTYMWNSKAGNKDIFVIANEGSVDSELTTLLGGYAENEPAGKFVEAVNAYSFSPTYTADEKNNIYLPYSFSLQNLAPKAGTVNTINAWLVPVATKFIFHFINERPDAINVNGISMKYANSKNYLFAHLGSDELEKELNGEPLSWVDWLAEISKNSWAHPDYSGNVGFNDEVGWIIDYKLPNPEDYHDYTFAQKDVPNELINVPAAETKIVDGVETIIGSRKSTKIFYIPESENFERLGADGTGQSSRDGDGQNGQEEPEHRFYLTMAFEDTATPPSTPPEFIDVAIPNLKALFRNTYVIVTIKMREGDIDVYAEIAPWNEKTANGWVSEGNAPSGNPFTVRKK